MSHLLASRSPTLSFSKLAQNPKSMFERLIPSFATIPYPVPQQPLLPCTSSRAAMYPTSCDTSYAKSERVCPCGERLARWLTAEYVVSTLSKKGKWNKVPASLSGPSLRPRCVPLSRLGGAPHPPDRDATRAVGRISRLIHQRPAASVRLVRPAVLEAEDLEPAP